MVEAAGEGSRPHLLIAAQEPKREYGRFSNTRSRRLWSGAFIRELSTNELSTKSSSLEKSTQVIAKHTEESYPKLRFFWEHGIAQLCNKPSYCKTLLTGIRRGCKGQSGQGHLL